MMAEKKVSSLVSAAVFDYLCVLTGGTEQITYLLRHSLRRPGIAWESSEASVR